MLRAPQAARETTLSASSGDSSSLRPPPQHLLWLTPTWEAGGSGLLQGLGLRQKQRRWCGGGQGSVWSRRLSISLNRQGHDGVGGRLGGPVHLQDLGRAHTSLCSRAEPRSGSQGSPVSPGRAEQGAGGWEKSCPWRLSDLRRACPAAMSSWAQGQSWVETGKGWQVFAEDLEA